MIINILFVIFIGLAWGTTVGAGYVAFLTVFGIIPRLTQLTKTGNKIYAYEWSVVCGAVCGTLAFLREPVFSLPAILLLFFGLAGGVYVGMIAAALTEVLNVFPLLAKRVGIDDRLLILMMAIVLGKICGSLFHWMYFVP
ncbi:stage V sporulation protein AB [Niallia sp. NCCP-28]|uniref:stage V sporulation protein AB n=1 Tax=Niallia sp. NCCP-28 TaxID=2934712 RepID=UPI00208D6A38|nr:stage V sporulation protein AB [Niallia sp. NCCP-28]GKU81073.1 stage V sporulation protein AB [Niallia sp. NCCP-28]